MGRAVDFQTLFSSPAFCGVNIALQTPGAQRRIFAGADLPGTNVVLSRS